MDSWYSEGYFSSDLKIAFDNFTRKDNFIDLQVFLDNSDVFYEKMLNSKWKEA